MPQRYNAFTLIELLVVVAIIAILAAIAIPNLLEAQMRSKISRGKADMAVIATGMEAYRVDNNHYPPDWDSGRYGSYDGEWRTYAQLTTPVAYLTTAPRDPFFNHTKTGQYFDYWGEDAVLPDDQPNADNAGWRSHDVHWFIYSYGPDQKDQSLPGSQAEVVARCYDPTNGTVSPGDLGRFNGGAVPRA